MATTRIVKRTPAARRRTKLPRVYGDIERFKSSMARHVAAGEALLDELEGVRRRAKAATRKAQSGKAGLGKSAEHLIADHYFWQWARDVDRLRHRLLATSQRALADELELWLPAMFRDWPVPVYGDPLKDNHTPVERWLRSMLQDLNALRDALGVQRNVAAVPPGRFEELRASGLVEAAVIAGWVKDSRTLATPKQLSDAIGAAKESVEATLRAALDRLHVSWKATDDLQQLMKKWRVAELSATTIDAVGARQLDLAQSALGNLLTFLSQARNAYGRGHGRATYAPGLRAHHARLAVDLAEAVTRYVVLAMDDKAQLPPTP